jgi:hypothetical protein
MDRRISVEWSLNEIASTMNRTGIRSTELASVLLWNAKPEGDNLGSVLRARRYVPTPPESTGIDTIHLLEMYTLLFIRAVQI